MEKCKDCSWYGEELVEMSKIVFEPLIDDYKAIVYKANKKVCNYTQPTTLIDNRISACNNFKLD